MVYIARDGTIANNRPWSVARVKEMFIKFFQAIYLFFMTLLGPLLDAARPQNAQQSRNNRSSGGGPRPGGGGGGSQPPEWRGRPAGFSRRIGRVVNMDDCNIPGGG